MTILQRFTLGLVCLLAVLSVSCAGSRPYSEEAVDWGKIRLIAVMPVASDGERQQGAGVVRARFIDELYFRGYPKIPTNLIDETIASFRQKSPGVAVSGKSLTEDYGRDIPPQKIREALGIDAVVYIDIKKAERSVGDFSASHSLTLDFKMVDARSGNTLWMCEYKDGNRIFGINKLRLDMEDITTYEKSLMNMVRDAASSMPAGKGL